MSKLNGRIQRLEEQAGTGDKTPVVIAGDLVWDIVKGQAYEGDPDQTVVVAAVTRDLWDAV